MPVVTGRFISLNGKPLDQMKDQHFPRRMLESAELSWADAPPDGRQSDARQVVDQCRTQRRFAVGEGVAKRLHLGVGSAVELEIGGVTRALKVAAIYRADGQHLGARVQFVLPSGQLKDQPATWYGGAHIDPKQVAAMERALLRGLSHRHRDQHRRCAGAASRASSIRLRLWCGFWPGFRFLPG